MRIVNCLIMLFFFATAFSQEEKTEYKNGYVLKGKDTIFCKVFMGEHINHFTISLKALINNDEVAFFPGGPITGFGITEINDVRHFGLVNVERTIGTRKSKTLQYIEKKVAGVIDFYDFSYSVKMTTRKTVNGMPQPASEKSFVENTNSYYIAKNDSLFPELNTPTLLSSLRKNNFEKYINDNPELFTKAQKKYSLKEFILLLEEYNNWKVAEKNK